VTRFMAIKINYDRRASLPAGLKYSRLATTQENNEYLKLYQGKGIGGDGFHECLNFFISDNKPVRIYFPPTCRPDKKTIGDEFVIFSFTYASDPERPSCIVGVHAGAQFLVKERERSEKIGGQRLTFHAEAPAEFVTLFPVPLEYKPPIGRYTPKYERWGFGLRYIEGRHAQNILSDALAMGEQELQRINDEAKRSNMERQLAVLADIRDRYIDTATARRLVSGSTWHPNANSPTLPDKELGELGEKHIYQRELAYVSKLGDDPSKVIWYSRSNPTGPFDIQSIRKKGGPPHYIEVKSTTITDDTHIFVSRGEMAWMKKHKENSSFTIVHFNSDRTVKDVVELTLEQLHECFEFEPTSFQLRPRN
jgi:Domain of unknown function (DUF3883)